MRIHDREHIGAALRRFKKLLERSGVKRELRAHEYYEKPGDAVRDVEDVLARELGGLTAGLTGRRLLLDFTNVDYLNSIELGTLITLHKKVEAVGGRLTLFNLSAQVLMMFTITRLDTLLTICK
jgi:ribosomal protein S21